MTKKKKDKVREIKNIIEAIQYLYEQIDSTSTLRVHSEFNKVKDNLQRIDQSNSTDIERLDMIDKEVQELQDFIEKYQKEQKEKSQEKPQEKPRVTTIKWAPYNPEEKFTITREKDEIPLIDYLKKNMGHPLEIGYNLKAGSPEYYDRKTKPLFSAIKNLIYSAKEKENVNHPEDDADTSYQETTPRKVSYNINNIKADVPRSRSYYVNDTDDETPRKGRSPDRG